MSLLLMGWDAPLRGSLTDLQGSSSTVVLMHCSLSWKGTHEGGSQSSGQQQQGPAGAHTMHLCSTIQQTPEPTSC